MHDFLSEEWIDAAREIRERHADDAPELPVVVRINQVITDVPFSEGELEAFIDTSDGALVIDLGAHDEPDVTITTEYELARSIVVGGDPQVLMQAFLEGRVRVQGDMTKLIALQAALAQQEGNEAAEQIGRAIQEITN